MSGLDQPIASRALTEEFRERLVQFRRQLHRRPELSLEEHETTKRIREALQSINANIVETDLKTGVCALVSGRKPGPCIAVRADIDALPIVEETALPFASEVPNKMHACGHDFHTAAVLGALMLAMDVAASLESFPGSILFLFQPAEEIGQGASLVLQDGVLQRYGVQAILGEHNQPTLPTGVIGVREGPLMASVDEFSIVVKGIGGHAAIPDRTVDPILVASHIVAGLQHLVSRVVSPIGSVVVTVGSFHAGTANNIIPPQAVLEGTVRCLQPEYRDVAEEHLRNFVTQTAQAFRAQAEINYRRVLPAVVNDGELCELVRGVAGEVVGADNVVEAAPTMAGEDFSLYQEVLPGCFFFVGTGKPDGSSRAWHHPQFDVDESMLIKAASVFVRASVTWLHAHSPIAHEGD